MVNSAFAGGFGPWSFGMSAEQIRAVSEFGPYKSFSNGDLETYQGEFGGQKENVQFFLKDNRLWRIGVDTYEGTDLSAAAHVWGRAQSILESEYGALETPNQSAANPESFIESARAIVAGGGKAQMAPLNQPKEEFVFSSFASYVSGGVTYYFVVVYYDQPSSTQGAPVDASQVSFNSGIELSLSSP